MYIELLDLPGCDKAHSTRALLASVLEQLVPGTAIHHVSVTSHLRAFELGFPGSPSVRVNGRDLEGPRAPLPALVLRLYPQGTHGAAPRWLLEAAVLRALQPRHLLFLCVANSARSPLAEGLARSLAPSGVRISSAGSQPGQLRPEAAQVLAELGIDASGQRAKGIDSIDLATVDAVITLCAEEVCPLLPVQVSHLHWGLPDPASDEPDEQARLAGFRAARDELQRRLTALLGP